MRATVTEFGPVLLSKILELNDTQTGVLNILFKYADDKNLGVVDFNDLKKLLNYLTEGAGAAEIKGEYGKISSATASTILRKIVSLEQQGVDQIFGETSFDVDDLFQKVDGKGVISLLNVSDIQQQPAIFSTFLLALLAEIYQRMPEAGDLDKPKLIFFLDEAHLLFKDAPKAFMDQIEQVIRLIRSKGVGVFFLHSAHIGCSACCTLSTWKSRSSCDPRLYTQRCEGTKGNDQNISTFRILRHGTTVHTTRNRTGIYYRLE